MHVKRLSSGAYRVPLPRPWGPDVPFHHLILTEIEAADGVTGTGFSWTPSIGAQAIHAMVVHDCCAIVEGETVAPEVTWDRLWAHLHEAGGGGVTTLAMAAIDIALWDLRAKATGVGLADLIGRRAARTPAYGSGVNLHYSLTELEDQARRWVAAGHSAVKIKVGKPDLSEDLERVAAVRRIIGRRRLMIDANQRWDLPTARRAIRALAAYDLHWVEEPLLADDISAHVELRRTVDVPIAVGENVYTEFQFRELLSRGACDFVQPNVARVGGITPFLRIARLARGYEVPVIPHLLPDISGLLALCVPLPTMVEDVEDASFAALGALSAPSCVRIEDGEVTVDAVPGHGLTFATDRMERIG